MWLKRVAGDGLRVAGYVVRVTRCGSFDCGFRIWDFGLERDGA